MAESAQSQIPQVNPLAAYAAEQDAINAAILRVLHSGYYMHGPEVEAFERELASWLDVGHVVACGSGTDALYLLLRAYDIGPGDEVITVAHTASATIASIVQTGAKPVFVDIDQSYGLNPAHLEAARTDQTRAVVPVHLYGLAVDMPAVVKFAFDNNLIVLEDCAQAHGAWYTIDNEPRRVGSAGDGAAFSFYPTKNMGAIGDGGAIAINRFDIATRLRELREYGWKERLVSATHGWNSRLGELQAAILRVKLTTIDDAIRNRQQLAGIYDRVLAPLPLLTPDAPGGRIHAYHQYVIRTAERDRLRSALSDEGIATAVHYPVPVHQQPAYQHLAPESGLPLTETIAQEIVSLPMFPELGEENATRVAETIARILT